MKDRNAPTPSTEESRSAHPISGRSSWASISPLLRRLIARDILVQLALAVFLATLLTNLLPVFDQVQRQVINTSTFRILQVLALWSLRAGCRRLELSERAFWNDLSVVYGSWVMVSVLYALSSSPSTGRSMSFYLTAEILLAIGYGAWVLAAERQPHQRHRLRAVGLERSLSWPATTAFVGGLMTYFILVPAILNRPEYETFLPSMLLYISLDIYLVSRFFYLARDTSDPRWRLLYGGLVLTTAGMLVGDLMELSIYYVPGFDWGTPLDTIYSLQPLVLVMTARLRHRVAKPADSSLHRGLHYSHWRMGPIFLTLVTALMIPALHFACHATGLLEDSLKDVRQALVIGWIGVLGCIAAIQHSLLAKRAQELWHDWRMAEKALRRSEQKARVLAERSRSREALRQREESFRLALQVIPSPLAILTRSDGRFREVNQAFAAFTGHRRQDLIGRAPGELGLWRRSRDAARLRRELRDKPTTLRRDIVLRARNGMNKRARLTTDSLLFQGAPSLIVMLREPPNELHNLADLAAGKPWIEHLGAELHGPGLEDIGQNELPSSSLGTADRENGEKGGTSSITVFGEKGGTWQLSWSDSRNRP